MPIYQMIKIQWDVYSISKEEKLNVPGGKISHFVPASLCVWKVSKLWWNPSASWSISNSTLLQNIVRFVSISLRVPAKKRMDVSWGGGTQLLGRSWAASSEARDREDSRLPDAAEDKTWMRGCWSMPAAMILGRIRLMCFATLLEL